MRNASFKRAPSALFSLPQLAAFCAPGVVLHRSFGFVIAARPGAVLLAPVGKVDGDFRQVRDGCPVPWDEVWRVVDAPSERAELLQGNELVALAPRVALAFSPYGWMRDLIRIDPAGSGFGVVRLCHESGLRCAFVPGVTA